MTIVSFPQTFTNDKITVLTSSGFVSYITSTHFQIENFELPTSWIAFSHGVYITNDDIFIHSGQVLVKSDTSHPIPISSHSWLQDIKMFAQTESPITGLTPFAFDVSLVLKTEVECCGAILCDACRSGEDLQNNSCIGSKWKISSVSKCFFESLLTIM